MSRSSHRGDPIAHSMTDLMAGVAVAFLLVASIFMVRTNERARKDAERADEDRAELRQIKSTDTNAIGAIKKLRGKLQSRNDVIEVEYDEESDPFLLTIVFNGDRLRFDEGQCAIRDDTRRVLTESFEDIFRQICETASSGYVQSITLEGHTDNKPFFRAIPTCGVNAAQHACGASNADEEPCRSIGFANNVRLSAARAQNVFFEMRQILGDQGEIAKCLDTKFVVAGRGPTQPENGNGWNADQDEQQRKANRRVVIRVRATSRTPKQGGA
jgi:flagellar motor protein MotB